MIYPECPKCFMPVIPESAVQRDGKVQLKAKCVRCKETYLVDKSGNITRKWGARKEEKL